MKVTIKRKKRKTISITVNSQGIVEVSAPLYTTNEDIKSFLLSKQKWIDNALNKIKNTNNEFINVLNYTYGLLYGQYVYYTAEFKKTYTSEAKEYLPKRLHELATIYGFKFNSVKIREFKRKWGSCNVKKDIKLNTRLIMLDKRIIDYVIIHELCHTIYMDHKKDFYNKLSSYFTNLKQIKAYLKKMSFITNIKYWINRKIYDTIANNIYFYIFKNRVV